MHKCRTSSEFVSRLNLMLTVKRSTVFDRSIVNLKRRKWDSNPSLIEVETFTCNVFVPRAKIMVHHCINQVARYTNYWPIIIGKLLCTTVVAVVRIMHIIFAPHEVWILNTQNPFQMYHMWWIYYILQVVALWQPHRLSLKNIIIGWPTGK